MIKVKTFRDGGVCINNISICLHAGFWLPHMPAFHGPTHPGLVNCHPQGTGHAKLELIKLPYASKGHETSRLSTEVALFLKSNHIP
jgi:hypothetical protein